MDAESPMICFKLEEQVLAREGGGEFPLRISAGDAEGLRESGLGPGDRIAALDAADDYFVCEILSLDGELPLVRFAQKSGGSGRIDLSLAFGLIDPASMEAFVRADAELGVREFLPLQSERALRLPDAEAADALEGLRDAAEDAALHAGRPAPSLLAPRGIEAACELLAQKDLVLVFWEEAPETVSLNRAIERGLSECGKEPEEASIALLLGPRGGLSRKEVEALLACNTSSSLVSLGPSVLRVETAAVVAPALVLYRLGALGGGPRGGSAAEA